MANRLLHTGTDASHGTLIDQLQDGESLVATWLRDPAMIPYAKPVEGPGDYASIVAKTKAGYYVELQFFASTQPSENHRDYHGGDVGTDLERMRSALAALRQRPLQPGPSRFSTWDHNEDEDEDDDQHPVLIQPAADDGSYGEPFTIRPTSEWQQVIPGLEIKRVQPTLTYRVLTNGEWSPNYAKPIATDWYEFTPGVQLRQSRTDSKSVEFRLKKAD